MQNFSLAGKRPSNHVVATFEVPNPVTPEFLAERHVGFVVEATQANGDQIGSRETAQLSPGNRESFSATAGNKQWMFGKIGPAVPAVNLSVSSR